MAEGQVIEVRSIAHHIHVTSELLPESENYWAAIRREQDRLAGMTAEEIRAEVAERNDRLARERAEERAGHTPVALGVDILVERLGWSRAYAEHFVQPWCSCDPFGEGPALCGHAEDEGLEGPWAL